MDDALAKEKQFASDFFRQAGERIGEGLAAGLVGNGDEVHYDYGLVLSRLIGPPQAIGPDPDGTAHVWTWAPDPNAPFPTFTTYVPNTLVLGVDTYKRVKEAVAFWRWLERPHYIGKRKLRGVERRGRRTITPWRTRP